jgi:nucleotidyltransferase/DNA polymerase involved in DNA repair
MGYSVDLNQIPLRQYMESLKKQKLLPGRKILLENLEENFHRITAVGIGNLAELKNNISSTPRLAAFAAKTGVPENYLIILKREIGSLEQKPVAISDFPDISANTISALLNKHIKTSKDVYNLTINPNNISATSREIGIEVNELQELSSLCNLVRINGIGPIAARTLYESGYRNIAEIAQAKASELLEHMNTVNANKQYYKAKLGEKDMQFIIDAANMILKTDK